MSDTKTRAEKKLSVIKPGHWRNKYRHDGPVTFIKDDGSFLEQFPGGVKISPRCFTCPQAAEQFALKWLATSPAGPRSVYLGPVFFPADKTDP